MANHILEKMLDRLFATLANGPSLNARPHSSRQRVDLIALQRLQDQTPADVFQQLLGEERRCRLTGNAPSLHKRADDPGLSPVEVAVLRAHGEQSALLAKLRTIAEDARDYEHDTGAHVLHIGYPLLSLPPGTMRSSHFGRRVLAPLAFISVNLSVVHATTPSVTLSCLGEGADLVVPNIALLAWLSRMTGKALDDIGEDQFGDNPWQEIADIVQQSCRILSIAIPEEFGSGEQLRSAFPLRSAPRPEDDEDRPQIVPAAVLGLYPMANQGLIRDTQALLDGAEHDGPLTSFLSVDISLQPPEEAEPDLAAPREARDFAQERLIAPADPFQARAVKLARTARGLVIHGPPGTGKSQTISNIIGDHLARAQRVLFVCDKRTALDVVMNRLEGMGLGHLCAIVHDPRRDQRDLYRTVRDQLENLSSLRTDAGATPHLERIDRELTALHAQLTGAYQALMRRPDPGADSFHELMGRWLAAGSADGGPAIPRQLLEGVTLEAVQDASHVIQGMLQRACACNFQNNPWRSAAGISLQDFLATPMSEIRETTSQLVTLAQAVDALPPFPRQVALPDDRPLEQTAQARRQAHAALQRLALSSNVNTIAAWLALTPAQLASRRQEVDAIRNRAALLADSPLDPQLAACLAGVLPTMFSVKQQTTDLDAYLPRARTILGWLAFRRKRAAAAVLRSYGLPLNPENARRVRDFFNALALRLALLEGFRAGAVWEDASQPTDAALLQQAAVVEDLLQLRTLCDGDTALAEYLRAVKHVPVDTDILPGLLASANRAQALHELFAAALSSKLLDPSFLQQTRQRGCRCESVLPSFVALQEHVPQLEGVLRTRHDLDRLPEVLRPALAWLLDRPEPPEQTLAALHRAAIGTQIATRFRTSPELQGFDAAQLEATFDRLVQLEHEKRSVTCQSILHIWGRRQRERLLAQSGTRLNSAGAELRRRLTIRGEHAMRLRQIVALGQGVEDGDPLFDLRPVWMASPETVAEIFPRKALFDIIVFDEASQCRLEEALPVLLRGQRVVIAGDPKQLPPTRFFETALAASEDEETLTTDQQLFEVRQGEIEDLLAASLNLEIEEAYLDVHYRSRNADLIEFSNHHFYRSRLQAIPAHPANRVRHPPITLYPINGIYEDRCNAAEAEKVCQIVHDLLRRAEPPSIGIACFNLQQRELVLEKLDELCEKDSAFAGRLAACRALRRGGASEGLFVRNLENVQGDERDHMIISTTYGPDPQGRFFRRFGPLGQAGGGRRLNVLITRARQEVHLVSSIPPAAYANLPPVPPDQSPGGAWLLFSYLSYAHQLQELYEKAHQSLEAVAHLKPELRIQESQCPSTFAAHLGRHMLQRRAIGSTVHWGNDGFCVDLALQHPHRPDDVTLGVLCDLTRFSGAADPVEWEVFRTLILRSQGWTLHRLWTAHFFRDPEGMIETIAREAQRHAQSEPRSP
jgi:hypothetical protein